MLVNIASTQKVLLCFSHNLLFSLLPTGRFADEGTFAKMILNSHPVKYKRSHFTPSKPCFLGGCSTMLGSSLLSCPQAAADGE